MYIKLPPFVNVAASQTAVLPQVPQGPTYERIDFKLGGGATPLAAGHMTELRIILGGKKIVTITGADLLDINEYFKETSDAAYLSFHFADPTAQNYDDYMAGALDTSNPYSDFAVEIDINGTPVTPTLEAYAEVSGPIPKAKAYAGMFRSIIKSTAAPSSAAEHTLGVPTGSRLGAFLRGVHLFHANVTKLQVYKDSFPLLQEGVVAVVQQAQKKFNRSIQAGLLSFDPMYKSRSHRDAVATVRANGQQSVFEIKATTSAADSIRVYSDLLQTHAAV